MEILISPHMTVAELLEIWPETARAFFDRHMICVGCSMSKFDTLSDAAAAYGINLPSFIDDITRLAGPPHPGNNSQP